MKSEECSLKMETNYESLGSVRSVLKSGKKAASRTNCVRFEDDDYDSFSSTERPKIPRDSTREGNLPAQIELRKPPQSSARDSIFFHQRGGSKVQGLIQELNGDRQSYIYSKLKQQPSRKRAVRKSMLFRESFCPSTFSERSFAGSFVGSLRPVKSSEENNKETTQSLTENDENDGSSKSSFLRKKIRFFCGKIVLYPYFSPFIILLIIANSFIMGLATFKFDDSIAQALETSDMAFLIIFTIELILHFGYYGFGLFKDGWLVFDFSIVVLSWSLEKIQVISSFRIFKSFRIIRAFRIVGRFAVLKNLIAAVIKVLPKMGAIMGFLFLILYIFAVMCTELFKDLYEEGVTNKNYFTTLPNSFLTLFQFVTLDWAGVSRQVMVKYPKAQFIFYLFVMTTAFIFYSLIVAVVCQAVKVIEHEGELDPMVELKLIRLQTRELKERINILQTNHTRLDKAIQALMTQVDINPKIIAQIQSMRSDA